MKKVWKACLLTGLLLCGLSGCDSEETEKTGEVSLGDTPALDRESHIDIDLTLLSATMVYSEVSQMVFYPEDYIGKTVKMQGEFFVFMNPTTGRLYFSNVIADALACCQQGIEFVLSNGAYPEDYPEQGTFITVTGQFQMYEEDGYKNIHLVNAVLS